MPHTLTGFGFGPIQAGLFAKEAFESGRFERVVVAEVDAVLVEALRRNKNCYTLNVAGVSDIRQVRIEGVELRDPQDAQDLNVLREALAAATEVVTALPSVQNFDRGMPSVAALIAAGLGSTAAGGTRVYAAENNHHAAECLKSSVGRHGETPGRPVRYLNTVIGKMSRVVEDPEEISALDLTPITPELPRALLVEEFNQIQVTQSHLPGFMPGLRVFQEKADLLPFEEAKLYGHNAVHALMGYLAELRGYERLADLAGDDTIMSLAEQAILQESGAALRRKYADLDDPLFTEEGFRRYATDLLTRITNPFLADRTDRVIRNPLRKLQAKDRLFGTMSLAIDQGIEPVTMALGSLAALHYLVSGEADVEIPVSLPLAPQDIAPLLNWVWSGEPPRHRDHVLSLLQAAWPAAEKLRVP